MFSTSSQQRRQIPVPASAALARSRVVAVLLLLCLVSTQVDSFVLKTTAKNRGADFSTTATAATTTCCFFTKGNVLEERLVRPAKSMLLAASDKQTMTDNCLIVDRMPDPLPNPLQHEYYLLRHGQSTANVAAVISSARSNAYSTRHGLTEVGWQQGAASAELLVEALEHAKANGDLESGDKLTFVASPFARAKQTAEACLTELLQKDALQHRLDALGIELATTSLEDILIRDSLMERYFGRLDNEVDKFNVTHTAFDVESVAAVCTRIRSLIVDDLEHALGEGRHHVVLTSHADVLQISQLYGCHAPNVGAFSSYRFGNGEVRAMARTPDSLPEPSPLEAPVRGTQVPVESPQ